MTQYAAGKITRSRATIWNRNANCNSIFISQMPTHVHVGWKWKRQNRMLGCCEHFLLSPSFICGRQPLVHTQDVGWKKMGKNCWTDLIEILRGHLNVPRPDSGTDWASPIVWAMDKHELTWKPVFPPSIRVSILHTLNGKTVTAKSSGRGKKLN